MSRARSRRMISLTLLALALALSGACQPNAQDAQDATRPSSETATATWAIAIHGGAGAIPEDMDQERRERYRASLAEALTLGQVILSEGGRALDAVHQVVRVLEDDPLFNAGRGAVFASDGGHSLDAAIMDGHTLGVGAVAAVERVKNPISLARRVMTDTPHVMLVGAGADEFAESVGFALVEQDYFFTQRRYDDWREAVEAGEEGGGDGYGTVGAVALDQNGNLAAATSTGGITNKRFGRVGDVPIVGAGTWADNATAAISCTGIGEEFIRHAAAHEVSAIVRYEEVGLDEAVRRVLHGILPDGAGGMIAVSRSGELVLEFTTLGMFRGAASSRGRFDVEIWKETGSELP